MPVVSPVSRYSSSSGSYRASLGHISTSLDRPYYSTTSRTYSVSGRSTYTSTTRTTYSYDSDSERSAGSRSRDASLTREVRPYVSQTTKELYDKYSPANYVPLSQRLRNLQQADTSSSSRPPRRIPVEVKLPTTTTTNNHLTKWKSRLSDDNGNELATVAAAAPRTTNDDDSSSSSSPVPVHRSTATNGLRCQVKSQMANNDVAKALEKSTAICAAAENIRYIDSANKTSDDEEEDAYADEERGFENKTFELRIARESDIPSTADELPSRFNGTRSIDVKAPPPPQASTELLSKSSGLNGLRNIGNTCFMNSVVQCLSNTKPLLEYCGSPDQFTPHINTTLSCMKGALIKAFSTVITELWKADETDGVVNTTSLKAQIQRFAPRFMGYSQQDAQEFLRYLLEGLHEDVNRVTIKPKPILTEIDDSLSDAQKAEESWQRYLRSEDSKVGDIFVGQLKSSLRCTHCSHTSVTFDPFWDLSLPIPSRTGQLKLTQCLSHFTREEELDGDEKPTCSKCQVRRKCLKWFTVQKFPRVLVIHLKRFSPTERFRGKLNVSVEFPLTGLDMTPYAATTTRGPPPPPAIYNLYAVSNHSGTTYSGHYTAYCKHPYNGEWHEYNDSRVSSISQKNVVSSEAYVLFYELANGSVASS